MGENDKREILCEGQGGKDLFRVYPGKPFYQRVFEYNSIIVIVYEIIIQCVPKDENSK